MSRTYRKMSLGRHNYSETAWINRQLRNFNGYTTIRVRKTKEQYDAETALALKERAIKIKKFEKKYSWVKLMGVHRLESYRGYPPLKYVSRYYYKSIPVTREQEIERLKQEYAVNFRDGRFTESFRSTGFKKKAARVVRRENQRFCRKIMMGAEYDHTPYPDHHLGDPYVWDFW